MIYPQVIRAVVTDEESCAPEIFYAEFDIFITRFVIYLCLLTLFFLSTYRHFKERINIWCEFIPQVRTKTGKMKMMVMNRKYLSKSNQI